MSRSTLKKAVSVILLRRDLENNWTCFWACRSLSSPFLGGYHAFLGGKLEEEDFFCPVQYAMDACHAAQCVCAVREVFEESALLLADSLEMSLEELLENRIALMDRRISFADFIQKYRVQIDARRFIQAGHWVTPLGMPRRYDTKFFAVEISQGQTPHLWEAEMRDGKWLTPHSALNIWAEGQALLVPPTVHILRSLAQWNVETVDAAPDWRRLTEIFLDNPYANGSPSEGLEIRPGILCFPLRTSAFPSVTHANCYVIGDRELVLIDPVSPYAEEQERLARHIALLRSHSGAQVREILLTHCNPDQIDDLKRLQEIWRVPIAAHPITAELLRGSVNVDRVLTDGDVIELPVAFGKALASAFSRGWRLCTVSTPGYVPGQLCFFEETTGVMIAGDLISGKEPMFVDASDADRWKYLDSLKRLFAFPITAVAAKHGPALFNASQVILDSIDRQLVCEIRIIDALRREPQTPGEILSQVYCAIPVELQELAERSVIGYLEKLIADGEVEETERGRYALKASSEERS